MDSHLSTPFVRKKLDYLIKNDFIPFKNKQSLFAMTAHIVFTDIDYKNTVSHSQKLIKLIRNKIAKDLFTKKYKPRITVIFLIESKSCNRFSFDSSCCFNVFK